jgi:hypothetical protein
MARVEGIDRVQKALEKLKKRYNPYDEELSVVVGYSMNYAVYVHENKAAKHPVGKAKFLEDPARQLGSELSSMISQDVKKGLKIIDSLLIAGFRLRRESQEQVPVDTSALRSSAFTCKEADLETEAAAAKARGEALQTKVQGRRAKVAFKIRVQKLKQAMRVAHKKR